MEPKKLYTIAWTQPYTFGIELAELDALMNELIEIGLECNDFTEANQEIERIMKL